MRFQPFKPRVTQQSVKVNRYNYLLQAEFPIAWSPAQFLNDSSLANPIATPLNDINYVVSGTDANGCTNSDSVQLYVTPAPILTITPNDTSICIGESVSLTVTGATTYVMVSFCLFK